MEGGYQSTSGTGFRLDGGIPSSGVRRNVTFFGPLHHSLEEGWGRQQQYDGIAAVLYLSAAISFLYSSSLNADINERHSCRDITIIYF